MALTVFAPTNAAFAAALRATNMTAETLLANKELLTDASVLAFPALLARLLHMSQ